MTIEKIKIKIIYLKNFLHWEITNCINNKKIIKFFISGISYSITVILCTSTYYLVQHGSVLCSSEPISSRWIKCQWDLRIQISSFNDAESISLFRNLIRHSTESLHDKVHSSGYTQLMLVRNQNSMKWFSSLKVANNISVGESSIIYSFLWFHK